MQTELKIVTAIENREFHSIEKMFSAMICEKISDLLESLDVYTPYTNARASECAVDFSETQTIAEMLYLTQEEIVLTEQTDLTEGVLDNAKDFLEKLGITAHKGKGLIQYLKIATPNIAKMFIAAIKGDKEQVRSIAKQVRKEDVIDFLLKLDQATAHIITGPIHVIDAITGWELWANIHKQTAQSKGQLVKTLGDAVSFLKQKVDSVFGSSPKKQKLHQNIASIEKEITPEYENI
ncbi:MAG: hypothetical protein BV459_06015 [Thermoplasmata archaeon M11B2D]|nr:MAG: hypothetical protein BV459_06015 [Thermoplasmata archaeon M11B2D]